MIQLQVKEGRGERKKVGGTSINRFPLKGKFVGVLDGFGVFFS